MKPLDQERFKQFFDDVAGVAEGTSTKYKNLDAVLKQYDLQPQIGYLRENKELQFLLKSDAEKVRKEFAGKARNYCGLCGLCGLCGACAGLDAASAGAAAAAIWNLFFARG